MNFDVSIHLNFRSGSEVSDADIVNKYLEKAKQTDKSFIE